MNASILKLNGYHKFFLIFSCIPVLIWWLIYLVGLDFKIPIWMNPERAAW